MKKISVIGSGYVGLSQAVLLSQINSVILVDIDKFKVDEVNKKRSTIRDSLIEDYLRKEDLNLAGLLFSEAKTSILNSEFVVLATPTDYNPETHYFNTNSLDGIIDSLNQWEYSGTIVIKSTIPVGYTQRVRETYSKLKIIFSPEFLREGTALFDNLHPDRIIVGSHHSYSKEASSFLKLLKDAALNNPVAQLTNETEAEAIKLFSNTYLAMRVAFFNELDSFSIKNNLNAKELIDGVSTDHRIGTHYNNPSFGYGGYCLPKDTKQLATDFENTPNDIITAIVKSNETRKDFLVNDILKNNPKSVGVYRIIMKSGSDNFRASSILDIMSKIQKAGVPVFLYEPLLDVEVFEGATVLKSLEELNKETDVIICNRMDDALETLKHKVYTRDVYREDK